MSLPDTHIQDEGEGDSLMKVDPTYHCPDCGGSVVWRGSKTCFTCWNGGAGGLTGLQKQFTPKKLGVHVKKK